MVGMGGLEPPTSSLSETRSNQLSYMPVTIDGARRQNWTADTRLFRPLLYHWATLACLSYRNYCRIFCIYKKNKSGWLYTNLFSNFKEKTRIRQENPQKIFYVVCIPQGGMKNIWIFHMVEHLLVSKKEIAKIRRRQSPKEIVTSFLSREAE